MRVVLVVLNGPSKGKQKLLRGSQKLRIGRTERSDWSFETDERMSSRHFEVWTDDVGCYIKDLGSRNGTLVNDQMVVEHMLKPGDAITAGDTKFQVNVEGGDESEARSRLATRPTFTDEGAVAQALRGELKVPCSMENCEGDWTLFRGQLEDVKPGPLCQILTGWAPSLWLLVDFNRLGQPRPETLPGEYLFDWLPVEVQQVVSPWAVACSGAVELEHWKPLINDGWGKDAVVGVLTDLDSQGFLAHLRSVCRVKGHGGSEGVAGLCWPSILSTSLLSSRGDLVENFMKGVKAVVVEFPDLPDTWQVFATADLGNAFKKWGFRLTAPGDTQP